MLMEVDGFYSGTSSLKVWSMLISVSITWCPCMTISNRHFRWKCKRRPIRIIQIGDLQLFTSCVKWQKHTSTLRSTNMNAYTGSMHINQTRTALIFETKMSKIPKAYRLDCKGPSMGLIGAHRVSLNIERFIQVSLNHQQYWPYTSQCQRRILDSEHRHTRCMVWDTESACITSISALSIKLNKS